MENDLLGLPAWYETSSDYLDPRKGFSEQRNTRRKGLVLNDLIVTVRSDLLSTLASWCDLVVSERGVTGPNLLDVRQLATFLIIHFTWLTAHPAAPDLVDQLGGLTAAARDAVALLRDQLGEPPEPDG